MVKIGIPLKYIHIKDYKYNGRQVRKGPRGGERVLARGAAGQQRCGCGKGPGEAEGLEVPCAWRQAGTVLKAGKS